jgi:lipid-binding SYLF domain-containing protein
MRRSFVSGLSILTVTALMAWPVWIDGAEVKGNWKKVTQAKIRKMANETLHHLYKIHPSAKSEIERSAGYAVFDDFGAHIFFLSTARGKGLAIDNETKKETFMKMLSAGVGPGLGIKDYRAVFVFETRKSFHDFINAGLGVSAQADAAAKAGHEGGAFAGAVAVAPGVWVYQITEAGLALQATLQGTKYYKDGDLN